MVGVQKSCSKHSNGFTRKNGLKNRFNTDILNQKCFLGEAERDTRTPPPTDTCPQKKKTTTFHGRIPLSKADDGSEHVNGYSDYELFPNQISNFLAIDVELKHV